MVHAFGPFELDADLYELRRGGQALKLAPKAFDLLLHLVEHRDRVVAKSELLDRLWPGEHVTESVLPAQVNAIRKALGEGRGDARWVQTVHGRGYRFVGAVEEREPAPAAAAPASAFVGRDRVLEELAGHLESALAGRSVLAFLAGEPGIGKTRTAEEFAIAARARGAWVLSGRCHEGAGAPAYWPWIQLLRRLVAEQGPQALREALGPGAEDVAHLVPELRERLPDVSGPAALDSDEARFRLFDSVASFLRASSRRRPLLLVLDDLHWADEATLLLLRFLAQQSPDAALLLLGTYRDVELRRTHPLARTLGELARAPEFHRITLRGLAEPDVARFIELATGAAGEPELARSVFALTEGNPFFLQEMVELLAAEGRLAGPVDEATLPQGVREAIGRRLDALDEASNDLLRLASVFGVGFGVNALEALAGAPRAQVLEVLERAKAARLVRDDETGLGRYRFSHVLIRETLYEELPAPERIGLHRRVGEILESIHGPDVDDHLAELAHHFFQAAPGGEVDRAVAYAERHAERAQRLLAFEEAVAHLERALQVLPLALPVDEARRAELLVRLGGAQVAAGRRDAALRVLRAAADVARRLGRGDLLTQVAITWPPTVGRQMVVWNAEYRPLVEEALQGVDEDALAARARLISALVLTPPDSDSMQRRDALSREAVRLARRAGDPAALFFAMEARLWACTGPDRVQERLAVASELGGVARASGSRVLRFRAHEERARSLIANGQLAEADLEIEACAQLAEELRLPTYRVSVARFRMTRAVGDGRFDEAERLAEQCAAWSEHLEDPDAGMMRLLWTLWILAGRGGLAPVAPWFDAAVEESGRWIGPPIHAFTAYFRSLLEDEAGARRHFEALAAKGFEGLPRDEDWLMTLAVSAEVAADLRDRRAAASLAELLRPFAALNVMHLHVRHYLGSGHHFVARLEALLGREDAARDAFEAALAANAALGAEPCLARTQYEYGRFLAARDATRAAELLASAERRADALGMQELLVKVRRARSAAA